ncbi:MAG: site-specific recombinase [Hydrogenophaga sp.]|uniref:site-specific recombinase n=1 Tax=Hydrogenophaga sp. TaxID=1904254 RepID=UPI00271985CD|nr:site-specific recombinase [Hydrogenophaga sp.]MDO9480358.1 site-specific recombinase [Hydrogenophaga sp.]MDP3347228.1 site-specific recombinase [Hydrogenophaga sp.]MDP3808558.1 site-specific recombinase [Hydrogenophaga sp.]
MELPQLIDALDAQAPLAQRHLWLVELLRWVRGEAKDPEASVARVRLFLDAVQARPEWQTRWHDWWQTFVGSVDATPLLADYGFAPRTAFLSELGHRLRRKVLPGTPETTDLAELFGLLLPTRFDVLWLKALDTATLERLRSLLLAPPHTAPDRPPASFWQSALMDALIFCVSQVSATGFASEIRVRMSAQAQAGRPFHELPSSFEVLRLAVQQHGPHSPQALQAAAQLREQLDACRHAAYTVYSHLEAHGVSVGIVFRLHQLRERIVRIKELLDCLQSDQPERATAALLADLAQVGQDNRSIRALIASSSHLTAAKVAERSAENGEHYITRDAAEYRQMLGKAAGGGAVIGVTTWVKFSLYALGLSAFWAGFAAGLNYAFFFVLIQLLHLTVATKQPAVTAPAMVAKLKHIRQPGAVRRFVDEVANLFRSQIASIVGNVGLVVPVVVVLSLVLQFTTGAPMITADKAQHVLHDLHLLGPTLLFAALTGVLLFASSIVAGWVENWFVFHKLDSAVRHNPRFTRVLGPERAARWATFLRSNVSGLAANISLGFMLGLVPAFAAFFGLGLDVRHVTLAAGQAAAAAASLGLGVLMEPAFWWAAAGIALVGPINLAVSFYLAFRLALRAQSISEVNRQRIRAAIWRRIRITPLSFLLPPRSLPEEADADLQPEGVPDSGSPPASPPPHG